MQEDKGDEEMESEVDGEVEESGNDDETNKAQT